jgi:hypothetical protein
MDPVQGLATMVGVYVGGESGGLVSACLLGIPGTPSAIATTFDGYPMAQKGQPGRAVWTGIWSSLAGGLLAGIPLVLGATWLAALALHFGPWELFSLFMLTLSVVAALTGGSIIKGLLSGVVGLLVTTIGTDCHQNTFPQLLADGERIDSYRRMMAWMSNHLLVTPDGDGSWDDGQLKQALSARRLYGVFEVMGYAEGFDFHALEGGVEREMGAVVSLASGVRLLGQRPTVRDLDPAGPQPTIRLLLWKAAEGGWQSVGEVEDDLDQVIDEPGAYRVEVRMTPSHLAPHVGTFTELAEREFAWVLSNAIYVE